MPTSATIRSIRACNRNIPLIRPSDFANRTQPVAENVLITIELEGGVTRGYGESAPNPIRNGETQSSVIAAIHRVGPLLKGQDVRDWEHISRLLSLHLGAEVAAQAGIEMALVDALSRYRREPLWRLFGSEQASLRTDMTIPRGTVEQAGQAACRIARLGIGTFKVQVGRVQLEHDIARLLAIHATTPSATILLDGNGSLKVRDALYLLRRLSQRNIIPMLFEQPVAADDLTGMRQVSVEGNISVAADEAVTDLASAKRVIRAEAAEVINVKIMKCGLLGALDIARYCAYENVKLMIGSTLESKLAILTAACMAHGLGTFAYVDLDAPLFLEDDHLKGEYRIHNGELDLRLVQQGHGVAPKW